LEREVFPEKTTHTEATYSLDDLGKRDDEGNLPGFQVGRPEQIESYQKKNDVEILKNRIKELKEDEQDAHKDGNKNKELEYREQRENLEDELAELKKKLKKEGAFSDTKSVAKERVGKAIELAIEKIAQYNQEAGDHLVRQFHTHERQR